MLLQVRQRPPLLLHHLLSVRPPRAFEQIGVGSLHELSGQTGFHRDCVLAVTGAIQSGSGYDKTLGERPNSLSRGKPTPFGFCHSNIVDAIGHWRIGAGRSKTN
jgi:hypothetical protein